MISTGCAAHIKKLAQLTATELDKVELKYITKDLNHLLRQFASINQRQIIKDCDEVMVVSFDIVNMFPSISKTVGLEQCKLHLDQCSDPIFSTQCVLDALEITLDNNLTEFDGTTYRQIKGTAMGPSNACAYGDVVINKIDVEVNEGQNWPEEYRPLFWTRYRDNVLVL